MRIATLLQNLNVYLASPTDTAAEHLGAELGSLREASVGYAPALANALANLLAHAEVLLARSAPTGELFEVATSNETAGIGDRLAAALAFERDRRRASSVLYERGALGLLALLAVLWIAIALNQRTRRAARPPERRETARAPDDAPAEPAIGARARSAAVLPPPDEVPDLPAAPATPAHLSAEAAMRYRYHCERVGESIAAAARRLTTRADALHHGQQSLRRALGGLDYLPDLPDGGDFDEQVEASAAVAAHMRRDVNAIADLARRLAAFARLPNGDAGRDMVDVNACIEEVVAATGAQEAAEVSLHLGAVPEVFASRTEIRLLLAQVLENSVHAVQALRERRAAIKIDTAARNDAIVVRIIDNGPGIAPDRRTRIFQAFYTSREGAMGLGLTLAGELVKRYEGGIKVNSLPHRGTVTELTLPTGTPGP